MESSSPQCSDGSRPLSLHNLRNMERWCDGDSGAESDEELQRIGNSSEEWVGSWRNWDADVIQPLHKHSLNPSHLSSWEGMAWETGSECGDEAPSLIPPKGAFKPFKQNTESLAAKHRQSKLEGDRVKRRWDSGTGSSSSSSSASNDSATSTEAPAQGPLDFGQLFEAGELGPKAPLRLIVDSRASVKKPRHQPAQRPCLNFDKMRQKMMLGKRVWRGVWDGKESPPQHCLFRPLKPPRSQSSHSSLASRPAFS